MSDTTNQQLGTAADVHASLRRWARGAYGDEAAVELLIRSFDGQFADPGWPWIASSQQAGEYWLNAEAIKHATGQLSGGEQRILAVVAALADDDRLERSLTDVMTGLDRGHQNLVLAALSHASGSHQQSDFRRLPDGTIMIIEPKALVPWPADQSQPGQDQLPLTSHTDRPRQRTSGVAAERRATPGTGSLLIEGRRQV